MRRVLLAVLALAACLPGASGAAVPARTLLVRGTVVDLAADGARVAMIVDSSRPRCLDRHVAAWQVGKRVIELGHRGCAAQTSTGSGVYSLALAGTRAAWGHFIGGNEREFRLRTATMTARAAVTAAGAVADVDGAPALSGVAGDGDLLVFVAGERTLYRFQAGGEPCPALFGGQGPALCRRLATTAAPAVSVAVSRGRIAVLEPGGAVELFDAAGTRLAAYRLGAEVRAIKLGGDDLAVLAGRSGAFRVDDYDATTGQPKPSPPVPPIAARQAGDGACQVPECTLAPLRLEDVDAGIAVYVLGRDVHAVRFADGRQTTLRALGSGPVQAQLEPAGLFYSYVVARSSFRGRVTFMPLAGLRRRLDAASPPPSASARAG